MVEWFIGRCLLIKLNGNTCWTHSKDYRRQSHFRLRLILMPSVIDTCYKMYQPGLVAVHLLLNLCNSWLKNSLRERLEHAQIKCFLSAMWPAISISVILCGLNRICLEWGQSGVQTKPSREGCGLTWWRPPRPVLPMLASQPSPTFDWVLYYWVFTLCCFQHVRGLELGS